MFPPHDAVNDALLRRVEEAEQGDDAGNLRLCERGSGSSASSWAESSGRSLPRLGAWYRGRVASTSPRAVRARRRRASRWPRRRRTWPRACRQAHFSWLSRRVVVVPRRTFPRARRRLRIVVGVLPPIPSGSASRRSCRRRSGPRRGAWVRRGRPSCGPGAEDLGMSQQKRSKNLGREDEQTHRRVYAVFAPKRGAFHLFDFSQFAPRAGRVRDMPRNERGAGPLVEMPWFCPGHRACDPTSNAPSAGEPASSACRPVFTPRIALTPLNLDRKPATMSCGGCAGFYYCDRAHQEMHWSDFDHHESCVRTKKQVARTQELRED